MSVPSTSVSYRRQSVTFHAVTPGRRFSTPGKLLRRKSSRKFLELDRTVQERKKEVNLCCNARQNCPDFKPDL